MIRNGIGNIRNDAARRQREVAAGVRREELNNQVAAMGQNMMAQAETLPSGILASSPELQQTAMAMANGGPVQGFQQGGGILSVQQAMDRLVNLGGLPRSTASRLVNLQVGAGNVSPSPNVLPSPSVGALNPLGQGNLGVDPSPRSVRAQDMGLSRNLNVPEVPDFIVDDETSAPAVDIGNMQFVPRRSAPTPDFIVDDETIAPVDPQVFDRNLFPQRKKQRDPESPLALQGQDVDRDTFRKPEITKVEITPEFVAQRDAMEARLQREFEEEDDFSQTDASVLTRLSPKPKKKPSKQDGPPLTSQIGTEVVNQAAGDSAIIKAENLGEFVTKARENLVKAESAVAGIENASSKEKQNAFEKLVNMIDEKIPKKKNLQEYVKDIDKALTEAGYEKPKEKTINGYNIAMIGFLIGSGKSPNALQNIVEGLGQGTKLLIKEEEKRKKERLERTKLVTGKALEAEAADTARRLSLINTKFGVMKAEISAAADDKRAQRTNTNRLVNTGLSALLQQQIKNIPDTSDKLKIIRAAAGSDDLESFNKAVRRFGPNFESFVIPFDSENPESVAAGRERLSSYKSALQPQTRTSETIKTLGFVTNLLRENPNDDAIQKFETVGDIIKAAMPGNPRLEELYNTMKTRADNLRKERNKDKK